MFPPHIPNPVYMYWKVQVHFIPVRPVYLVQSAEQKHCKLPMGTDAFKGIGQL